MAQSDGQQIRDAQIHITTTWDTRDSGSICLAAKTRDTRNRPRQVPLNMSPQFHVLTICGQVAPS